MNAQEYKDRFIARFTSKGVSQETAVEEYLATIELVPDIAEDETPEADADECMSYWTE